MDRIKTIVTGISCVGKSAILSQYIYHIYSEENIYTTVNDSLLIKEITIEE